MKKILRLFLGIFLFVCLAGSIWCCSPYDRASTKDIPETNLKVISHLITFYESDDVTIFYDNYLMDGNDTVAYRSGLHPFINAKGVVCIPQDGVYDCRDGKREKILSLEEGSCTKIFQMDDDDYVLIEVVFPDKQKFGGSQTKEYTYNLRSKTLTN